MSQLRKLPIGIQDFECLRKDGYLYLDKTGIVYRLINTGRSYFLSRPHQFGKSLLISTLKAMFGGKRGLFDGLAITQTGYDWTPRPVLHLDLNTLATTTTRHPSCSTASRWRASASTSTSRPAPSTRCWWGDCCV